MSAPGRGHFWLQGNNLNNLGRGPLGEAMYQISKAWAFWFQTRRRLKFSLIIGGFYPKSNDQYFMIIYPCIKYESNTLIFSKDIKWKPYFEVEKEWKLP